MGRPALGLLCGVAVGLVAWGAVALFGGGSRPPAGRGQGPRGLAGSGLKSRPAWSEGSAASARMSLVAQARVPRVAVYRSATASRPRMTLANPNRDGAPLVFLVAAVDRYRLRVLLPTRPNLSQGWIARRQVGLARDSYRIAVRLASHRMTIWRDGRLIQRYRVGIGRRAVTPTPLGRYYITELLRQPDPGGAYGPYAFGLSAYSDVLHEFAGGNGEIGIHGTNDPSGVGKNVSHGCIRVYNSVIIRLAHELPLGTPVQIEQ